MKLDELFKRDIRSSPLTGNLNQQYEKILDDCSEAFLAFSKNIVVYKGIKNLDKPVYTTDPRKGYRMSANTSNYYTLLMDNLPVWKDYPKRSRSLICSTNWFKAKRYGNLYIVLPLNGAKFGVCPSHDIWDTDIEPNFSFNAVNAYYGEQELSESSYPEFLRGLVHTSYNFYDSISDLEESHIKHHFAMSVNNAATEQEMEKVLSTYYNPQRLGFKLLPINEIPSRKTSREVWTDSPSYLINTESNFYKKYILPRIRIDYAY